MVIQDDDRLAVNNILARHNCLPHDKFPQPRELSQVNTLIKILDRQDLHITIPNHILPPHPASHTFMCALAPQGKQRNQN